MQSSLPTPIRPRRSARFLVTALPAALAIMACDRSPTGSADEGSSTARASLNAAQVGAVAPITVEILSRAEFTDEIAATFRLKVETETSVLHVKEPSEVVHAKFVWQPGAATAWHTHYGPAIVAVASGALTYVHSDDCESRVYGAGKAFIDPGQGHVHIGRNDTAEETVAYVTFFAVPPGQGPSIPVAGPAC